ncbi:MAG: hypothetical protein KIT83_03435 [Bryobacterales bacterium]|nr:hypothetical protein [Bryobacterales bacterium]
MQTTDTASPAALLYGQRMASTRAEIVSLEARAARLSSFRLAAFLLLLGATGFALWSDYTASLAGLAAALVLLIAIIVVHERLLRRIVETRRRAQYWSDGIQRIEQQWAGKGISGKQFLDPHHLYAEDLDLFGVGSLFELLCSARTSAGEAQLASWLTQPATPAEAVATPAGRA